MTSCRIDKNVFREVGVFVSDWFRIHAVASSRQLMNQDQNFTHTHSVAASVVSSETLPTASSSLLFRE